MEKQCVSCEHYEPNDYDYSGKCNLSGELKNDVDTCEHYEPDEQTKGK